MSTKKSEQEEFQKDVSTLEEENNNNDKDKSLKSDQSAEASERKEEERPDEAREEQDEKDLRIEELEKELAETQDSLLRKAAEVENMRKRLQRERSQLFENAKIDALEKFLPVNDDLQRTKEAVVKADVAEDFKDGVTMVADKFEETLKSLGVETINETGVPFNVALHDALFKQKADDDSVESNTVLQIVENGYRLGDRTIRHAKVIVSE